MGTAYPIMNAAAAPSRDVLVGVWLVDINADGQLRRQQVLAGAYPAVGTPSGGLPTIASLVGHPDGKQGEGVVVRGLSLGLEKRWSNRAFSSEKLIHSPKLTPVPGGIAAAATVLVTPPVLEVAVIDENGSFTKQERTAVSRTTHFSTTIAFHAGWLAAFTVVEGDGDPASRRVFGASYRFDGP